MKGPGKENTLGAFRSHHLQAKAASLTPPCGYLHRVVVTGWHVSVCVSSVELNRDNQDSESTCNLP